MLEWTAMQKYSGRDSNPQPSVPKTDALPLSHLSAILWPKFYFSNRLRYPRLPIARACPRAGPLLSFQTGDLAPTGAPPAHSHRSNRACFFLWLTYLVISHRHLPPCHKKLSLDIANPTSSLVPAASKILVPLDLFFSAALLSNGVC